MLSSGLQPIRRIAHPPVSDFRLVNPPRQSWLLRKPCARFFQPDRERNRCVRRVRRLAHREHAAVPAVGYRPTGGRISIFYNEPGIPEGAAAAAISGVQHKEKANRPACSLSFEHDCETTRRNPAHTPFDGTGPFRSIPLGLPAAGRSGSKRSSGTTAGLATRRATLASLG